LIIGELLIAIYCSCSEKPEMSSGTVRNALSEGLIRVGEEGIAQGNDAAINAYFADGYVLHGPNGELDFEHLKQFFAALRSAFREFKVSRDQIVVEGNMLACRTIMSGIFEHDFTQSPVGTVRHNGERVSFELINIFRYNEDGRLIEEWVQMDNRGFLKQLGVNIA
jgi:predicted ester cyclase